MALAKSLRTVNMQLNCLRLHCKNYPYINRYYILTEPVTHTFVYVNRWNNEVRPMLRNSVVYGYRTGFVKV